jgi:hypothetical protein
MKKLSVLLMAVFSSFLAGAGLMADVRDMFTGRGIEFFIVDF